MGARRRRRAKPVKRETLDRYQVAAPKTYPELSRKEKEAWSPVVDEESTPEEKAAARAQVERIARLYGRRKQRKAVA